MAVCPNCGNTPGENAIFCDRCGTRLPQPEAAPPPPAPATGSVICPACGAGNVPGEAFCDFCGSPLAAPTPVEVPAAAEAAPAPAETPAAPEAAPAPAETPAAPAEQGLTCPACQAPIVPGEAFCANCGASLAEPPLPPEPVPEAPAEALPSPLVPELVTPPPPVEAPPPVTKCPVCNAEVEPDDTFCSSCGASLTAAPAPVPEPAVPAPAEATPLPSVPAGVGPRLVIVASGAEIPLPAKAEILLGREDPISGIFPDVDMTPHGGDEGGISRRHARMIVDKGMYFIEDLDSTNYTFVNKQKLVPKTPQVVSDGDEIRLGRVNLIFKM